MNAMTLVVAGGIGFAVLAGGVLAGLSALGKAERRNARIQSVVAPHLRATALPPPRPSLRQQIGRLALLGRIAGLVGIDLDLRHRYPLRWWMVLVLALAAARIAAGMIASLLGDSLVMLTLPLWLLFSRSVFGRFHTDHRNQLFRQLPDALGLIIRATRIGIPATEAMRSVAKEAPQPTAEEFRKIADRLSIGMPFDRALAETALTNGVSEYRFFATAMALQAQTGGGLSETLENLADVVRKRVALRARGIALASEARTSAAILAGLPFGAGGLIALLNPSYAAVLIYDESGRRILAVAVGMLLLGVFTMQATIRKSLS
jgi:tight adherence protein B